jgi:hypothetical protein
MNIKKAIIFVSIVFVFVAAAWLFMFGLERREAEEESSVLSFEECVLRGQLLPDTYPEECQTEEGLRFIRTVSEEEILNVQSDIVKRGKLICLPHWNTKGPTTLECAFGLLDDDGNYFVLREDLPSGAEPIYFSVGDFMEITGTLVPGSDKIYRSVGTIYVTKTSHFKGGPVGL